MCGSCSTGGGRGQGYSLKFAGMSGAETYGLLGVLV